jgi:hypothetical protein
MELATYAAYLKENDGFEFITDYDFGPVSGKGIQLGRNSVTTGYMVIVQLDWDTSGYDVSLMRSEGKVTPNSSSSITDLKRYTIGNESVPSIEEAIGEKREVVDAKEDTNGDEKYVTVQYSVPGTGQGLQLLAYTRYLQENENFLILTDANFNDLSDCNFQLGKNSKVAGYALILQFDWDTQGYTITFSRYPGSVTLNEEGETTVTSTPVATLIRK